MLVVVASREHRPPPLLGDMDGSRPDVELIRAGMVQGEKPRGTSSLVPGRSGTRSGVVRSRNASLLPRRRLSSPTACAGGRSPYELTAATAFIVAALLRWAQFTLASEGRIRRLGRGLPQPPTFGSAHRYGQVVDTWVDADAPPESVAVMSRSTGPEYAPPKLHVSVNPTLHDPAPSLVADVLPEKPGGLEYAMSMEIELFGL